jgi:hypothetical protein
MALNHKIGSIFFAVAVGLALALASYRWISDSSRSAQRAVEEAVVLEGRQLLRRYINAPNLRISDSIERVRAAGKVYIFPTDSGWELSGHYQRENANRWHPYLMALDPDLRLLSLAVEDDDEALRARAATDPVLTVSPGR